MPTASSSAATAGGPAASSHRPGPPSGTGTAAARSSGTNAPPITSRPRVSARPGVVRALHQAVTRVWNRTVLSPETANRAAVAAPAKAPSPPRRRTSSGSARYTWKVSTYEPVIAAAKSRNGRLARIPRHWASTVSRAPPGSVPAPSAARRAGRLRICTRLSTAKIPAAVRQVTRNPAPVRTIPTSGPSRMPAW